METLQNEADIAIQWFKDNFMIVSGTDNKQIRKNGK